ncbi:hypothetical protein TW65_01528 [Stemphylium lycopersici]|nr:hypothetical protein TW65_01528 [Stemphylium lycopersici]
MALAPLYSRMRYQDTGSMSAPVSTTVPPDNAPIAYAGQGYPGHQLTFASNQGGLQAPYNSANSFQACTDSFNAFTYGYFPQQQEFGPAPTNEHFGGAQQVPVPVFDYPPTLGMGSDSSSEVIMRSTMPSNRLQSASYTTSNDDHTWGSGPASGPYYTDTHRLHQDTGAHTGTQTAPFFGFGDRCVNSDPWSSMNKHTGRIRTLQRQMDGLAYVANTSIASRTTTASDGTSDLRSVSQTDTTSNNEGDMATYGHNSQLTVRTAQPLFAGKDMETGSPHRAISNDYDVEQKMAGHVPMLALPSSIPNQYNFGRMGLEGTADITLPFTDNGPRVDPALSSNYASSMTDSRAPSQTNLEKPKELFCKICRKRFTGQYCRGNRSRHTRNKHQHEHKGHTYFEDP